MSAPDVTLPSPRGMDRNSPEYRAAVRRAVEGAPPIDPSVKAVLRGVFTPSDVVDIPQQRRVAS